MSLIPIRTLSTARLTLRPLVIEDFPGYRAYAMDPARMAFVGGAVSEAAAFDKFSAMVGHWQLRGFGRYAIAHGGKAIGHVGPVLRADYDLPEMTWSLWAAKHEGRGYATEAVARILAYLMADLGWDAPIARIEPANLRSLAVAERLGAQVDAEAAPPAWFPAAVTYRFASLEELGA